MNFFRVLSIKRRWKKSSLRGQLAGFKSSVRLRLVLRRHQTLFPKLVRRKAGKSILKVAFVAPVKAAWKLEPLLERMEKDDAFETVVVVPPVLSLHEDLRRLEQDTTQLFFKDRYNSRVLTTAAEMNAIDPDLYFTSTPHKIMPSVYYDKLFKRKLCCYVPYTHGVDQYNGYQAQYNQLFHNAMWRIFAPHKAAKEIYNSVSAKRGENVVVTGFPACEPLLYPGPEKSVAWKAQSHKKIKIIWAPHHSIDLPELPYATFLEYADKMVELAKRYREEIQWAFKPHPLLKTKLYRHPDWGEQRTDSFFDFWETADFCQLEEAGYVQLFRQSDAMIHDSASFMAEYLYVNKPVLFMQSVSNLSDYLSDFGKDAFDAS